MGKRSAVEMDSDSDLAPAIVTKKKLKKEKVKLEDEDIKVVKKMNPNLSIRQCHREVYKRF